MELCVVYTSTDHFKALSAKAALDENGIEALFPDQYHGAVQPHLALGGISHRIMVRREDREKALQLLSSIGLLEDPGAALEDRMTPPSLDSRKCTKCGSRDLTRLNSPRGVAERMASILLIVPFRTRPAKFRCNLCGHRWSEREPN
jgi:hypothetical protein